MLKFMLQLRSEPRLWLVGVFVILFRDQIPRQLREEGAYSSTQFKGIILSWQEGMRTGWEVRGSGRFAVVG